MPYLCRILLSVVLALVFGCGYARALDPVVAASEPTVRLTEEQAIDFREALDALASQGHVAIVAEGVPFKATLTVKDAPAVTADTPLTTAVTRVATAYDYDVERDGSIFLLKKRYTDPHDLPGVTLDECRLSVADVAQILDAFSPHYPASIHQDNAEDQVLRFVSTLSPAQEQAMQNKTLHCRDLTPDQQALIRATFLYMFVQMPLIQVQPTVDAIQQAPHADLCREQQSRSGLLLATTGTDGIRSTFPLSQTSLLSVSTASSPVREIPMSDKKIVAPVATLGQIVAGMTVYDKPVGIDPSLVGKPITVAGLANAPPRKVLQALASVYGLATGTTAQGGEKLTRPALTIPNDLQEMPAAIWAALPEPFSRAAHAAETVPFDLPGKADASPAEDSRRRQQDQENTQKRWQNMRRPDDIRQEAVRQLLERLTPRFKAAGPGASLAVATLSPGDQDRLGVVLIGLALSTLSNFFNAQYSSPVTASLSRFDDILVYGEPYEDPRVRGRMTHSLYLSGTDPSTGQSVSLGGVGFR